MHFPLLPFHRKKNIPGTRNVSSLSHMAAIECRAAGPSKEKKHSDTVSYIEVISSQSPVTQPSCICMSFQHGIPDLMAVSFSIFQRSNNACKDFRCSRYRPCGEVHLPIWTWKLCIEANHARHWSPAPLLLRRSSCLYNLSRKGEDSEKGTTET